MGQILLWVSFAEVFGTLALFETLEGKRAPGDFGFDPLGFGKQVRFACAFARSPRAFFLTRGSASVYLVIVNPETPHRVLNPAQLNFAGLNDTTIHHACAILNKVTILSPHTDFHPPPLPPHLPAPVGFEG
jgi:hypothetical protein